MSEEAKVVAPGTNEGGFLNDVPDVPELTPEEIAAKEREAAGKEGGEGNEPEVISVDGSEYVVDENGNALNEDGTVFKTKEELAELGNDKPDETNDENQVEIDGVAYTIDEEGNAVDENGEVKYTKEDIDNMASDGDDTPSIELDKIIEDVAIPIYDEQGNKIEYENSEEGIKKYVSDVYRKAVDDGVSKVFETYPVVQDLINHFQLGGTIENFNSVPDYSNVELNKDNEEQLKNIIVQARTMRGDRPEAIERYITAIKAGDKDNDNLLEEATVELEYLNGVTEQTRKEQEAIIQQQRAEEDRRLSEYWGVAVKDGQIVDLGVKDSIYNTIKSGKVNLGDKTWTIPEKIRVVEDGKPQIYSRDDFFRYLYEPIVVNINGQPVQMTRHQIDIEKENANRNVGNDVYDAFKRFVKYDESQFIQEQVNKDKVKHIRKLTTKRRSGSSNNKSGKTVGRVVAPKN